MAIKIFGETGSDWQWIDRCVVLAKSWGTDALECRAGGDEDRAKAKSVAAKEGMTWRSFWNERPHGPISVKWGVSQWPTVYVIDANGVIRNNDSLRGERLDKAVELLVKEAELRSKHS